jgi:hypothetical protein
MEVLTMMAQLNSKHGQAPSSPVLAVVWYLPQDDHGPCYSTHHVDNAAIEVFWTWVLQACQHRPGWAGMAIEVLNHTVAVNEKLPSFRTPSRKFHFCTPCKIL